MRELAGAFPDRPTLEAALHLAARAPSRRNAQPWRWRVDDAGVHLYADAPDTDGSSLSDRRDVLLGCGAVLHHCAVALGATGWHPRVHRFPTPTDRDHLAILEVVEQPPREADVELATAIPRRRADRRPYRGTAVAAGTLELLHIRAARLQVELAVVPRSRWTLLADGEVALGYGASTSEAHDDAALLVLGTAHDDDVMRMRAGEALSRVMLAATAMGLATCPLTKPLDDLRSRLALACEVFDGATHPQALLRVGVPTLEPDGWSPVERRPVHETTTWER